MADGDDGQRPASPEPADNVANAEQQPGHNQDNKDHGATTEPSNSEESQHPTDDDGGDSARQMPTFDKDSVTLAQLAASSSSSLPMSPSKLDADIDPDSPSFMLVASLRSQITDLTSQVTSLNSKLVRSYTATGDLEDELHDKRESEQRLQQRVKELEDYRAKWETEIERGGWVERENVQGEMRQLMSKVLEETKSRETAVEGQKALETEIENLTSTLFDEANKMVAVERMTRARAEEKMHSLEEAGSTMQDLFDSVQVNLRDTVAKLEDREKEVERLKRKLAAAGLAPETPDMPDATDSDATKDVAVSDGSQVVAIRSAATTAPHSPSLSNSLVPPRLLTGALPFQEFLAFVQYLRHLRTAVLSRPFDSPTYTPYTAGVQTLGARGYGNPAHNSTTPTAGGAHTPSPHQLLAPHLSLSTHLSQPFLKRCVEEDSDPSLRLDLAPGLGFLSRRNVATAVVDGTLLIEPFFASPGAELPSANCALCGTSLELWSKGATVAAKPIAAVANVNSTMKKMLGGSSWFSSKSSSPTQAQQSHASNEPTPSSPTKTSFTATPFDFPSKDPIDPRHQVHIFRINDTSTNRYAVCPAYCLARLRSVCEFWTYVRTIERGLLLEEGGAFKFVKGWAGADSGKVAGGTASAKASVEGLGLVGAVTENKVVVTVSENAENVDAEKADNVEDEKAKTEEALAEEENPLTEEAISSGPNDEKAQEDEKARDEDKPATEDATEQSSPPPPKSPVPNDLASHANASTGSLNKPPVPKRSANRPHGVGTPTPSRPATPVAREEKQASFPSSPNLSLDIPVAPNGATPRLSPRHPAHGPAHASEEPVGAAPPGWEDYCWNEVVRLKELMFWTRVAAVERAQGGPVESRLAVTGGQR